MKKLLIMSSAVAMSLSLVGCGTMNSMNDGSRFVNSTAGTGVKYTAAAVGTGVGVVSNTGAVIGRGVGSVVSTGAGLVSGHPATYHQTRYRTNSQVVYHNGHRYMLRHGKYVRID